MNIIQEADVLKSIVRTWQQNGQKIGFVPTMGWFHNGHLALMKESIKRADKTVVSLFVNPRQFGPHEDLANYPRDLQRDAQLAEDAGVDILFSPSAEIIYPDGYQTTISVQDLSQVLCGASRPGHFDGVTTVVTKLFHLVQPDIAIFGEKDFQQLVIIKRLVKDLNFNIEIIGHPIVREPDGLAMSSRNKYLDLEERKNALCLYRAIEYGRKRVRENNTPVSSEKLIQELSALITSRPGFEIDYIAMVDKKNLLATDKAERGTILALAVYVNRKVRLIDNTEL